MDEILFKRLLLAGVDDEDIGELIKLGYFKRIDDTVCRTSKYRDDTDRFISSKKDLLYKAVKELGSAEDIKRVMEITGIKDYITFVFIAEELIQEGKLIKTKGNNWAIKQ